MATTPWGKEVKKRLIDLDKNQVWLIDRVKEKTGLYFDSSYLFKVLNGVSATPKVVSAISEILDIPETEEPHAGRTETRL